MRFNSSESIRGFTLIELLIALLVGSIILLGVSSFLQNSASAHKRVSNLRLLQDDAGYGATLLRQQIAQIGYRSVNRAFIDTRRLPVAELNQQFPAVDGEWLAGQTIKADASSMSYRFSGASTAMATPDGSIQNCVGDSIDEDTIVESVLRLENGLLTCTVNDVTETIMGGLQGSAVEQMQVHIGIDDGNDRSIDRFINATAAADTDFVNAKYIRIRFLLASEDYALDSHQTYMFDGAEQTATDLKLRKEVVIAMGIRN